MLISSVFTEAVENIYMTKNKQNWHIQHVNEYTVSGSWKK